MLLLEAAALCCCRDRFLFAASGEPTFQPFAAQVKRLIVALQSLGSSLPASETNSLERAFRLSDADGVAAIHRMLDPHVLFEARINPKRRASVARGKAKADLMEHGWRTFLVRSAMKRRQLRHL